MKPAARLARWLVALQCAAFAGAAFAADDEDALTTHGIAGEIMDVAVEHCRRGEQKEALAMFEAIRSQLDPPPGIVELIAQLEATGCNTAPATAGGALRLQAGGGWDSNVSQGITARTLVLGSAQNTIELELDPTYQPRAAFFAHAMADYSLNLPHYGASLQFAIGQRVNRGASEFDLRTVSAAASKEFALAIGSLRAQLESSEVWLGGRRYQRSESGAVHWIHHVAHGAWLATFDATSVRYLTQPLQNAMVWELGLLREWRVDSARSVHLSFSAQLDDARAARPGGNRGGFQAQAGAVVLARGWRLRPQLGYTHWNSEQVFAPGLLDVRRRNRLLQVSVHAEKPLQRNLSLVLEWRGRWARDTIALYRYRAQVVSATLSHRF